MRSLKGVPKPHDVVVRDVGLLLAGLSASILWFVSVRDANFSKMSSYGLVSIVHGPFFVGLAILAAALASELVAGNPRTSRLLPLTILLVVYLYGTACAVEPIASLWDSWLHSGFTQYIIVHGHSLNNFDARFSWPGAFSLAAVVSSFAGRTNTLGFIRWFPLFIELAYLAPLLVIASSGQMRRRTAWLGVILFYSTNWIYQDYFSPQALNYLFFVVIVAAVLNVWRPRGSVAHPGYSSDMRQRLRRSRLSWSAARLLGDDSVSTMGGGHTIAMVVLLSVIVLASSMSHQLTPFAIIVALLGLLMTRQLGRPELLLIGCFLALGWLSLGASNYWVGHLNVIFGSFGQFGTTLSSNVNSRLTGSASHRLVVYARILDVAFLYLLAAVGVLRRATDSRTLEILTLAPFLLLAAQNYGGEGLLRVVLFGLPFVSVLAACAFLPSTQGPIGPFVPKRRLGALGRMPRYVLGPLIAVTVLAFSSATFIVRGGNDAFESFSKQELAASKYAYAHARAGEAIWLPAPFMPIGFEKINVNPIEIAAYQTTGTSSPTFDLYTMLANGAKWVVLGHSETEWGIDVAGYPHNWMTTLVSKLKQAGYVVVATWNTAMVLHQGALG